MDLFYGMFIGGFVVVGFSFNGVVICLEVDGMEFVDFVIFFNERKVGVFVFYYLGGFLYFFDEMDVVVVDVCV